MKLRAIVARRLFGADAHLFEPFVCLQTLLWGCVLMLPGAETASAVFKKMFEFAQAEVWGVAFIVTGSLGLAAWFADSVHLRAAFALLGCIGGAAISFLILQHAKPVVGVVTLPLCAVFSGLVYVRLAGIARG